MSIIVSGSLCYDNIMNFHGKFKDHILPSKIHALNISFPVKNIRRSYGGNAGNIAYGIKMFGGDPLIISIVGRDGGDYLSRLAKLGISTCNIIQDHNSKTASCFITTDLDDNQITAFYSGSPSAPGLGIFNCADDPMDLAIIAPNNSKLMLDKIKGYSSLGIQVAFDPGQQITTFNRADLRRAISKSHFVLGNDYEINLMQKITGWSKKEILERTNVLITTLGSKGSVVETADGDVFKTKACKNIKAIDPTGAGDAYRAGFFTAYANHNMIWRCAKVGSVLASYAVETQGTQEYFFTQKAFYDRYHENYK